MIDSKKKSVDQFCLEQSLDQSAEIKQFLQLKFSVLKKMYEKQINIGNEKNFQNLNKVFIKRLLDSELELINDFIQLLKQ